MEYNMMMISVCVWDKRNRDACVLSVNAMP